MKENEEIQEEIIQESFDVAEHNEFEETIATFEEEPNVGCQQYEETYENRKPLRKLITLVAFTAIMLVTST